MLGSKDSKQFDIFDEILNEFHDTRTVKDAENIFIPSSIYKFPNGQPLVGKYAGSDTINSSRAVEKGMEVPDAEKKRKFKIHLFDSEQDGKRYSVAGSQLDNYGFIEGNYYLITEPEKKQFRSSENGETRQFKESEIMDITKRVLSRLEAK